ncbi:glycosyl transferase, partial [Achromobacter dolens]
KWWGDQLLNRALPAWLFLGVLWLAGSRERRRHAAPPGAVAGDPGRALLLSFGLTPLVFVSVMALISGSHIQLH